ncbi:MAG: hypothetical protein U0V70_13305 [Terriglobia bacterium]
MRIVYLCQRCYRECQCNPVKDKPVVICRFCRRPQVMHFTEAYTSRNQVDSCAVCQGTDFYVRDDVRRLWGFFFLAGGILLAYPSYGASLILGGWGFYWYAIRYPKLTICYHCYAKYHESRLNPAHREFDLKAMEAFEKAVRNDRSSRDFNLQ